MWAVAVIPSAGPSFAFMRRRKIPQRRAIVMQRGGGKAEHLAGPILDLAYRLRQHLAPALIVVRAEA